MQLGASRSGDTLAELVVANHVLAMLGLVDAFGHISMRDPEDAGRYFMAGTTAPALVAQTDIRHYDLDSNPFDGRSGNGSIERFIHGEIYKRRPDVGSVVHTHSPNIIAFSASTTPLRPIAHTGAFLAPEVPVFDSYTVAGATNMMISDSALGGALADSLGKNAAILLRGHGGVMVAPNVGMAVYRAYFTEKSAELLMQASALGGELKFLRDDESRLVNGLREYGYTRQWALWQLEVAQRSTGL